MSPTRRTVRIVPRGPMLIQGPVEIELDDLAQATEIADRLG